MQLTEIEQEVVYLKAITETIDSVVNHNIIDLSEPEKYASYGAQAIFKTDIHQRYFNIILIDFLSTTAKKVTGKNDPFLSALDNICKYPFFNINDSIRSLSNAVSTFKNWLEHQIEVDVWFSTISLQAHLKVKRMEFIKICGNISKHNFARLSGVVGEMKKILEISNIQLSDEDGLLIIDDFYERFHVDIFSYHGSHLVEQLNNIRWGIHEYLEPEYNSSIVYKDGNPPMYHYTYPKNINAKFAQTCYWNLMNEVRSKPFVKKFTTYNVLQNDY